MQFPGLTFGQRDPGFSLGIDSKFSLISCFNFLNEVGKPENASVMTPAQRRISVDSMLTSHLKPTNT